MESQLLTSSLLPRNSSAPVARINMSAHSAGSENGIKIGWAASLDSGPSSRPVCHRSPDPGRASDTPSKQHKSCDSGFSNEECKLGTGLVS